MNRILDKKLQYNLQKKLKRTFNRTIDNPVIKAQTSWNILSDQLGDILGPAVHTQWFRKVKPLVLKNNILLLQTETPFAAQWITTHYQELVETLLLVQDKNTSVFFIGPSLKKEEEQSL